MSLFSAWFMFCSFLITLALLRFFLFSFFSFFSSLFHRPFNETCQGPQMCTYNAPGCPAFDEGECCASRLFFVLCFQCGLLFAFNLSECDDLCFLLFLTVVSSLQPAPMTSQSRALPAACSPLPTFARIATVLVSASLFVHCRVYSLLLSSLLFFLNHYYYHWH